MNAAFEYHLPSADPGVTRLLLLRHGEVHADDCQSIYGQMDVRLSDWGHEQSRLAGLALRRVPLAAVYTSPLRRAAFLGDEVARHHGLQPLVRAELKERFFGSWQGMTWKGIEEQFPDEFATYTANRFLMRVPGGAENFEDLGGRVLPVIREAIATHPGRTVAVTCHGGPLRVILRDALQMPISSLFLFEQDYCCLNVIDYYPEGRARVKLMNATTHAIGSSAPRGTGG